MGEEPRLPQMLDFVGDVAGMISALTAGMKHFALVVASLIAIQSLAHADTTVANLSESEALIRVGRVVHHIDVSEKAFGRLKISFTLIDHGGSTDMSATQSLMFSIYRKGEMSSTDLSFRVATVFTFKDAKRIGVGKYRVRFRDEDQKFVTMDFDANKAILAVRDQACQELDCIGDPELKASIVLKPPVKK